MNLSVTTTEQDGTTVITAGGEIDVYTAPKLRDALDQQISAGRLDLIADLSGVSFIDSTGLGVLVGRLRYLTTHEGSLRVVTQSERVLRVFDITGLDAVFPIHATLEEACTAARAQHTHVGRHRSHP
ncbi:anti-sigma factor antagonist [Kribbia dieselivorans]|uniref:anti-sigma factor antagonist n=1 Tax=Kribbia dieselivorans TaxID=331526 RepID=UPI0008388E1D|nr:anti-sigma factor antagonist [Kribbia dieselivorans]